MKNHMSSVKHKGNTDALASSIFLSQNTVTRVTSGLIRVSKTEGVSGSYNCLHNPLTKP